MYYVKYKKNSTRKWIKKVLVFSFTKGDVMELISGILYSLLNIIFIISCFFIVSKPKYSIALTIYCLAAAAGVVYVMPGDINIGHATIPMVGNIIGLAVLAGSFIVLSKEDGFLNYIKSDFTIGIQSGMYAIFMTTKNIVVKEFIGNSNSVIDILIQFVCSVVAFFVASCLLYTVLNKIKKIKHILPMWIVEVVMVMIITTKASMIENGSTSTKIIVALFLTITIFIVMMMVCISIVLESDKRNRNMEIKMNEQTKYYENLAESYDDMRNLRHDMINHIQVIKMISGDNKELEEYANELISKYEDNICAFSTGERVFDTLLYQKKLECNKRSIVFEPCIRIEQVFHMDNVDTVSLFANIMDNAIEACDFVEEEKRFIKLNVTEKSNTLIIVAINSKSREIEYKQGKTTKIDKKNHGRGLRIVNKIVEKYNGVFTVEDHEDMFELKIMLHILENEEQKEKS